ncbi:hypothetical protein C8R47DRAFT_1190205 [Mycena vitilis]|nr:hypothetical protein C8R47DRAFT_1190205 [Mycena vitilis]
MSTSSIKELQVPRIILSVQAGTLQTNNLFIKASSLLRTEPPWRVHDFYQRTSHPIFEFLPILIEMPTLCDALSSIVVSALAINIALKSFAAIAILVVVPLRLPRTAREDPHGHDVHSQDIGLQREISAVKLETLRNSRSHWNILSKLLKGRTVTVALRPGGSGFRDPDPATRVPFGSLDHVGVPTVATSQVEDIDRASLYVRISEDGNRDGTALTPDRHGVYSLLKSSLPNLTHIQNDVCMGTHLRSTDTRQWRATGCKTHGSASRECAAAREWVRSSRRPGCIGAAVVSSNAQGLTTPSLWRIC